MNLPVSFADVIFLMGRDVSGMDGSDLIAFEVPGKPAPAGSKRAFANPRSGRMIVTDANPAARPWKAAVALAAREAMGSRALLPGALAVAMIFEVPRPKSHYGSGRNAEVLKRSAPEHPTPRPDLLKLARAVEDACTGVLWRDDAQIVAELLQKRYGGGYVLRVRVISPPSALDSSLSKGLESVRRDG
jgi:Holliday junction resolvase RusA-like endonuclease